MKGAVTLWSLLLALGSVQAQTQAGQKQMNADPVLKLVDAGVTHAPSAYFSGAQALRGERAVKASDAELKAAYDAIAAAKARIESNRKCQKFFHSEGTEKISQTLYTVQDLRASSIAAQVEGNTVALNRNPSAVFMKPPQDFAGLKEPGEIRAFYILHELAHELSKFTGFVNDHMASARDNAVRHQRNNQLLIQNCY